MLFFATCRGSGRSAWQRPDTLKRRVAVGAVREDNLPYYQAKQRRNFSVFANSRRLPQRSIPCHPNETWSLPEMVLQHLMHRSRRVFIVSLPPPRINQYFVVQPFLGYVYAHVASPSQLMPAACGLVPRSSCNQRLRSPIVSHDPIIVCPALRQSTDLLTTGSSSSIRK